jgi:hypothetical protein
MFSLSGAFHSEALRSGLSSMTASRKRKEDSVNVAEGAARGAPKLKGGVFDVLGDSSSDSGSDA